MFCCNHTCYCVNIVFVTSASRYITSASRKHPRYQSRSSMYIRGLIPRNFAELAEAVPIASADDGLTLCVGWIHGRIPQFTQKTKTKKKQNFNYLFRITRARETSYLYKNTSLAKPMRLMQYSKNRDQSANMQSFLLSWSRRDHFFYIFLSLSINTNSL